MIDTLLYWIEKNSKNMHDWAWKLRRRGTPSEVWVKKYKKWKKSQCPHN